MQGIKGRLKILVDGVVYEKIKFLFDSLDE